MVTRSATSKAFPAGVSASKMITRTRSRQCVGEDGASGEGMLNSYSGRGRRVGRASTPKSLTPGSAVSVPGRRAIRPGQAGIAYGKRIPRGPGRGFGADRGDHEADRFDRAARVKVAFSTMLRPGECRYSRRGRPMDAR